MEVITKLFNTIPDCEISNYSMSSDILGKLTITCRNVTPDVAKNLMILIYSEELQKYIHNGPIGWFVFTMQKEIETGDVVLRLLGGSGAGASIPGVSSELKCRFLVKSTQITPQRYIHCISTPLFFSVMVQEVIENNIGFAGKIFSGDGEIAQCGKEIDIYIDKKYLLKDKKFDAFLSKVIAEYEHFNSTSDIKILPYDNTYCPMALPSLYKTIFGDYYELFRKEDGNIDWVNAKKLVIQKLTREESKLDDELRNINYIIIDRNNNKLYDDIDELYAEQRRLLDLLPLGRIKTYLKGEIDKYMKNGNTKNENTLKNLYRFIFNETTTCRKVKAILDNINGFGIIPKFEFVYKKWNGVPLCTYRNDILDTLPLYYEYDITISNNITNYVHKLIMNYDDLDNIDSPIFENLIYGKPLYEPEPRYDNHSYRFYRNIYVPERIYEPMDATICYRDKSYVTLLEYKHLLSFGLIGGYIHNNNYYDKYIKYKTKYIKLKNN